MELITSKSLTPMALLQSGMMCSARAETLEQKKALHKALVNPTFGLKEKINIEIELCDLLVDCVETSDEETGEMVESVRMVLFDTEGNTYGSMSKGVFTSVRALVTVFGSPTWGDGTKGTGIKVRPVEVKTKNGFMTTLEVV